jgi:hypothetical protein
MSTDDTADDDGNAESSDQDAAIDEEDEESFPASDPPSSWSGPSSDIGE